MNLERYSEKTDEVLEFYPFQRYKNHNILNSLEMKKDAVKRLKDVKDFDSCESDIILATLMKTGTHWTHEIISMLLSQQTKYNIGGLIMDMNFELLLDIENSANLPKPRLFHTHMPFQYLPRKHIENGYKIVNMNRNPKDRHVSMFLFLQGKTGIPDWTWADYFELFVMGKGDLYGGWFNDTKEWLDAKKMYPDSIFLLHYEQFIKEPEQAVKNLATFLNVQYTEELIREIVNKCSFENLKNNKVDASRCIHPEGKSTIFREGQLPDKSPAQLTFTVGQHTTGKIGGWKKWFTVSQNEKFEELYKKEMAGYDVEFTCTS